MTGHLLIIEDDETIRTGLCDYFSTEGYRVTQAADGHAGSKALAGTDADLVLLDLMLPGPNGLDLLREFRGSNADTPVIILTARGEESDKVLGLELGADDCVTKPFGLREVAARVRAHLRRAQRGADGIPRRFTVGAARIDLAAYELTIGGIAHPLSPKEVGILELLWASAGEVVSRTQFLNEVWGSDQFVSNRTIDTHILHLRQKLELDPKHPCHLVTVHGVGYRLCP